MYIPGQTSLPPVDRDECRFAQASRQMFESVALPAGERDPKMHSGGLVVPMLVDVPRLNKPPLVYWLQSASAAVFTWGRPLEDAIWMYRVPSVLSALVAVFATWRLGLKMLDPRAALLGAMLLAVAPMVVWDAHQARADQLLLACTTVCMGGLWGVWSRRAQGRGPGAEGGTPVGSPGGAGFQPAAFLFWFALAAGIMAKGPVTPLVALFAIVWLSFTTRSWRWVLGLRPLMGAGIVAACVVPWVWAVAQRQGGLGPYAQLVWDEFFARGLRGSKEGHFAPPGTHTVLLAALFWPGSLLTLAGFVAAWKRARGHSAPPADMQPDRQGGLEGSPAQNKPSLTLGLHVEPSAASVRPDPSPGLRPGLLGRLARGVRSWLPWNAFRDPWRGRDAEMFLIAWIVPMWVVFELSLAKLPHYTMPMYPAIALVSARMVMRHNGLRLSGGARLGVHIWACTLGLALTLCALTTTATALGAEGSIIQPRNLWSHAQASWIALAIGLSGVVVLARLALKRRVLAALLGGLVVAAASWAITATYSLPIIVPGADSAHLCKSIKRVDPVGVRPIVSVLQEDSMVFGTRGRVARLPLDQIDAWLAEHPTGLGILPVYGSSGPPAPWQLVSIRTVNWKPGERFAEYFAAGDWNLAERRQ